MDGFAVQPAGPSMMLVVAAGVSAHSVPGFVDADARATLKFYGIAVWVLFCGFSDSTNEVPLREVNMNFLVNIFFIRVYHSLRLLI